MTDLLKNLAARYAHKSGRWILSMLLCLSFLPVFLKSLAMLLHGNALSWWLVVLLGLPAWPGIFLFIGKAVRSMDGPPAAGFVKTAWRPILLCGAWLAAVFLLTDTVLTLYIATASRLAFSVLRWLYIVGLAAIGSLAALVLAALAFWLASILASPENGTSFARSFAYWRRHPVLALGSVLSIGLLLFLVPRLYDGLLTILPGPSPSFLGRMTGAVLLALLQWLVLQPLFLSLYRHAVQSAAWTPAGGKQAHLRRRLSLPIAIALIAASGLISLLGGTPLSPVAAVRQDIENHLAFRNIMANMDDPAAAADYQRIAEARILAWKGAALGQPDASRQAIGMAPSDEQVLLLAALADSNPLAVLENGLLNGSHSASWYLALLEAYDGNPNLNARQKALKAEILHLCIAQGYYVNTTIAPERFKNRQDNLTSMLQELEDDLEAGRHYALIVRLGENGGLNRQLVLDTLVLAESLPEHIGLQQLAMAYGSSFLQDNADYYVRTADAALRYDALYMEQVDKKTAGEEILAEKLTVARALLACRQIETCLQFLDRQTYESDELTLMKASCRFTLEQYDACLLAVEDFLRSKPDHPQALYMAALCTLKQSKTAASISYATKLADIAETAKDPLAAEALLYPYLLRFTISDGSARYADETYSRLGEADMALLKSHEFLYHYATAASLWAKNNDDARAEALKSLEIVLAANDRLSRAIYLQGAIYNELKQNDKALDNFQASLALDDTQPTVWYALASLYDKTERYEEAYAACQKVLDHLPSSDHASDVYGVSIHASQLMEKLKPYIKAGD